MPLVLPLQSDLYSAHFSVRKAQGGSRYSDWLHAILHKLEGDFRNAKMWYTDLGNNNKGAVEGSSNEKEEPSREGENVASKFLRFHQFWFVPSTNGGSGERASASGLNLTKADGLPRDLGLTAHQHTDLVFLAALVSKAKAKSSFTSDVIAQEVEKHYEATTLSADKIKDSKACFPVEEMQWLYKHLQQANDARETVADLTRLELVWMLSSLTKDFGWKKYGVAETMDALKLESTPAQASLDSDRKDKAANMVFEPGAGQRRF